MSLMSGKIWNIFTKNGQELRQFQSFYYRAIVWQVRIRFGFFLIRVQRFNEIRLQLKDRNILNDLESDFIILNCVINMPYLWKCGCHTSGSIFEVSSSRDGVDHEPNIFTPLFESTRESETEIQVSLVGSIKFTTDKSDKEFEKILFHPTETDSSEYLLKIFQSIETEGGEPRNLQKCSYCFKYYQRT